MKSLRIHKNKHGLAYLHTWRTGHIYYQKNRDLLLRDWTNLNHRFHCHHVGLDDVLVHDSRRGIPAPDNSFDAIYSCHVIEHLSNDQGESYLKELARVLKPGGVCRISTPDLERETREYIKQLDASLTDPGGISEARYELAREALIDQLVRTRGGGNLIKVIRDPKTDPAYAMERYGDVYREFVSQSPELKPLRYTLKDVLFDGNAKYIWDRLKLRFCSLLGHKSTIFTGENEVCKWDRYSLGKAFCNNGFSQVEVQPFDRSDIPHWREYNIDTSFDGETPIERSLYIEGVRV